MQVFLFLLIVMAPITIFSVIMLLWRKWTFRSLVPYVTVYVGLSALLLGAGLGLSGWDLVAAFGLGLLVGFGWSYSASVGYDDRFKEWREGKRK